MEADTVSRILARRLLILIWDGNFECMKTVQLIVSTCYSDPFRGKVLLEFAGKAAFVSMVFERL